jgi:D-alanyl-D-alanine carboxypeptidase
MDSKHQPKHSRKRTTKQTDTLVLIAAVAAIVVCGVLYVLLDRNVKPDVVSPGKDGAFASLNGDGAESDGGAAAPGSETDGGANAAGAKPYYYDSAREGRYAAFAANHPEIPADDIYWMVDCDLDTLPYADTHALPDPNDILLMVNKHFYLPADYVPSDLVYVGKTMMRAEAGAAMQEMIDAAAAAGQNIWSQSGFRSYGVQVNLYRDYSARDGEAAADTYSARPGYSEHQTGLTTDLNTITDAFGGTPEGQWVAENCWQYGYIVRYTKENTDVTLYKPEPWHMRYIGRDAAKTMHDEGILSLEEYWVKYVLYQPLGVG